jgi:hypothetical protein
MSIKCYMNMVLGRFKSTAWFYVRYRPGYPDVLFNYMKASFHLNGSEKLSDLGCGRGHLAIPIASYRFCLLKLKD